MRDFLSVMGSQRVVLCRRDAYGFESHPFFWGQRELSIKTIVEQCDFELTEVFTLVYTIISINLIEMDRFINANDFLFHNSSL